MNENKRNYLNKILSSDKSRTVFIIAGLLAIVLIFISNVKDKNSNETVTDNFNTAVYQENLRREILSMVENIEGVGKAKVMLTLEDSYEYIYLDDGETLQKINEPTIRGVVVACEGASSAKVSAEITELLRTVLNVPANKVCVTKLT